MPKADEGFTIDELARAVGATPRAVRFWVRRGVLPSPPFRGRATRYPVDSVARIRAMRRMRIDGLELREIRKRLDNATAEEIAAWGADAGGAATPAPQTASASADAGDEPAMPRLVAEQWQRLVLVPGLELHVRRGAGEVLLRLANEIASRYAARP